MRIKNTTTAYGDCGRRLPEHKAISGREQQGFAETQASKRSSGIFAGLVEKDAGRGFGCEGMQAQGGAVSKCGHAGQGG